MIPTDILLSWPDLKQVERDELMTKTNCSEHLSTEYPNSTEQRNHLMIGEPDVHSWRQRENGNGDHKFVTETQRLLSHNRKATKESKR